MFDKLDGFGGTGDFGGDGDDDDFFSEKSEPSKEPIDSDLYIFTVLHKGQYVPVFVGPLVPAMIKAYPPNGHLKGKVVHIGCRAGDRKFECDVDREMFLVNAKLDLPGIAMEVEKLDMFVNKKKPAGAGDTTINYPKYFTRDVEAYLTYKLCHRIYERDDDGEWVELEL